MRHLKIPPELDKRRKLTLEQREDIHEMFHKQGHNKSELSRMFGVSRATIGEICHPERKERENPRRRPDKRRNAAAQARYRERKKQLVLDGKIKKE